MKKLTEQNKTGGKPESVEIMKNELLSINKKAFIYLHETFGYDLTKPYTLKKFNTPVTIAKIEKEMNAKKIILFVESGHEYRGIKELKIVCISENNVDIERKNFGFEGLSWFNMKKSFETARKGGTKYEKTNFIFAFCQEENYILKKNELEYPDTNTRYFNPSRHFQQFHYMHNEKAVFTNENGKRFYRFYDDRKETPETMLDKSGYCVSLKREDLAREKKKIHDERSVKMYNETGKEIYLSSVAEMEKTVKNQFCENLKKCFSYNDYKKIQKKTYDLNYFFLSVALFRERTARKSENCNYKNIYDFLNAYESIKKDFVKIIETGV